MEDSGLYQCMASNSIGYHSAYTKLTVVTMPKFTVRPPAKLEATSNKTITVRCQATGQPKPFITWAKKGGELPKGRSNVSEDGTLQIWSPESDDSGRYTCTASLEQISVNVASVMELTVKIKKRGQSSTKS